MSFWPQAGRGQLSVPLGPLPAVILCGQPLQPAQLGPAAVCGLRLFQDAADFGGQQRVRAQVQAALLLAASIGEPIIGPEPVALISPPAFHDPPLPREDRWPRRCQLADPAEAAQGFLVNKIRFFQNSPRHRWGCRIGRCGECRIIEMRVARGREHAAPTLAGLPEPE
jgi:hypothetical protein